MHELCPLDSRDVKDLNDDISELATSNFCLFTYLLDCLLIFYFQNYGVAGCSIFKNGKHWKKKRQLEVSCKDVALT